jgi:hypothetical protein
MKLRLRRLRALPFLLVSLLLAGCASADKDQPATTASMHMNSSTAKTSGMQMEMGSTTVGDDDLPTVNGVKPVASQVLATTDWQGMKIQARTMTPTPFVLVSGTASGVKETMVKPPKGTSFHLMIMLNDAHTGYAIPYAGVWATIITSVGKVVYDQQQLPMLSAYMGPHYGNNVALPGAGHYKLKLLISPPVSARHLEYQHVWLKPHTVIENFTWNPKS